ncbi:MAG: hypothetical protein E7A55_14775 [Clostridium perfringens]|nr:hypothetical protein [Clostridium perfringens]
MAERSHAAEVAAEQAATDRQQADTKLVTFGSIVGIVITGIVTMTCIGAVIYGLWTGRPMISVIAAILPLAEWAVRLIKTVQGNGNQ